MDNDNIYAVAAANGEIGCIVIANPTDDNVSLDFDMNADITKSLITVEGFNDSEFDFADEIPANSIITLCVEIK